MKGRSRGYILTPQRVPSQLAVPTHRGPGQPEPLHLAGNVSIRQMTLALDLGPFFEAQEWTAIDALVQKPYRNTTASGEVRHVLYQSVFC